MSRPDRPRVGSWDAHPQRDAYQVTAADLGKIMADDQMAEYREAAEQARAGRTTLAEVWAYVVAGMLCMTALGWLLTC
ncbi:hypothetical protein [Kitasatospora sp. NPDC094016]|uniref:hypothetical protein n=1 Tax=Kitasatospora sp. NPDC094016 TaxID=3154986 RepID=UPI003330DCBE